MFSKKVSFIDSRLGYLSRPDEMCKKSCFSTERNPAINADAPKRADYFLNVMHKHCLLIVFRGDMANKIGTFVLAFIGLGFVYSIIAGLIISGYTKLFVSGYGHHLELLFAPILGGIPALIHAFLIANRPRASGA